MKLPTAPDKYDKVNEQSMRNKLAQEDDRNVKKGTEWNVVRLVFTSPNGTRYQLTVSDAGAPVFTTV